jgi:hypothetical protein
VPDVNDLDGAGKVLVGDIPDPFGAIAQHHPLFGPFPAAFPSFGVQAASKLLTADSKNSSFGGFDAVGSAGSDAETESRR